MGSMTLQLYFDVSILIKKVKDRLFYFYKKEKVVYCDIFNLKDYTLLQRVKINGKYPRMAWYKGTIFYALSYSDNEDRDLILNKLEF